MDETETRREFCGHACRAASLAALSGVLASILASCGGSSSSPTSANSITSLPQVNAATAAGGLTLTVDSSSPLASPGSAAFVQSARGSFLVARTGASSFTALTAVCTHQACLITGRAGQAYFCNCHGSEFDTNGRVVVGPAVLPLQQYATQFDAASNTLTITA